MIFIRSCPKKVLGICCFPIFEIFAQKEIGIIAEHVFYIDRGEVVCVFIALNNGNGRGEITLFQSAAHPIEKRFLPPGFLRKHMFIQREGVLAFTKPVQCVGVQIINNRIPAINRLKLFNAFEYMPDNCRTGNSCRFARARCRHHRESLFQSAPVRGRRLDRGCWLQSAGGRGAVLSVFCNRC
jgi:hypothetical protein